MTAAHLLSSAARPIPAHAARRRSGGRALLGMAVALALGTGLTLSSSEALSAPEAGAATQAAAALKPHYVRFAPGRSADVESQLRGRGGEITYTLKDLDTFVVSLPEAAISALQNNPAISLIEPVPEHRLMAQVVPWNVDQVQARDIWDSNRDGTVDSGAPDGSGVKICIIDTGIHLTHSDFQGITISGTTEGTVGTWNTDGNGHGTHVAGTVNAMNNNIGVVGILPGGAELYIVKYFNDGGTWGGGSLAAAADKCRLGGANVITMSLGGGGSVTEDNAFQNLYDTYGIINIAAAGNSGNDTASAPARYDSVISVAALDQTELAADFSQTPPTAYNPNSPPGNVEWDAVELSAGGVDVLSTVPSPNGNVPNYSISIGTSTWYGQPISQQTTGTAVLEGTGSAELVAGGLCMATNASWNGKVVLCERGTNTFAEKVNNVASSGGVATAIYNNVAGELYGTCGGACSNPNFPAIGLSQANGQQVLAQIGQTALVIADDGAPCAGCSGGYAFYSGTSMATPAVAAAAALTWSACGGPTGINNKQLRQLLRDSAKDLTGVQPVRNQAYGAGWDRVTGWGLVQLADAQELGNTRFGSTCPIGLDIQPAETLLCGTDGSADFTVTLDDQFLGSATLASAGLPVGTAGAFSLNPLVHPVKQSVFTLSGLGSLATGNYGFTLNATDDGAPTNTAEGAVAFELFAANPAQATNAAPSNGATGAALRPAFSWSAAADAAEYVLEVSTSAGFASIAYSATVTGTSHTPSVDLAPGTEYFWRVRASNVCGSGTDSATTSFTTVSLVCQIISSVDVPKTILDAGGGSAPTTTNSVLTSAVLGQLNSVRVVGLQGSHPHFSDLTFNLISPAATNVRVMNSSCTATNLAFNLGLSDVAVGTWPCPPNTGLSYLPSNALSAFAGEAANGTWTLRIVDSVRRGGGAANGNLQAWALEVCVTSAVTTHAVTAAVASGSGTIAPALQSVNEAGTASGTLSADAGWALSALVGDTCAPVDNGDGTWSAANITAACAVSATFAINSYTVEFRDWDNSLLSTQLVDHGNDATAPADPSRVGYTFSGWDVAFTNVTSNLTVTATYTINSYTVNFVDWDATVLSTQSVDHGNDATAPADPSRVGYNFAGWDVAFTNVTSNLTVTAQYVINSYTVNFLDWDGAVLSTQSVDHGNDATAPADPSRAGYAFAGWDVGFTNVTSNLTVTATYTINSYTVNFLDWDGAVLSTQSVDHGNDATAPADPTRVGYTFAGWDVGFTNVTSNLTVTATYTINSYTVNFVDWDASVLSTQSVDHGGDATAPANPTRTGYTFAGWDVPFTNVTNNLTVTATYTINSYTVNFLDWDGAVLSTQSVDHGDDATAPTDPTRVGYAFAGWDVAFTNITANLTVTATYTINSYTVTFQDWDGATLDVQLVDHGSSATAPADPTRTGHTFSGWDVSFTNITSDLTVIAQYTINSYLLTYTAGLNGSISGPASQLVEHGSDGAQVTAAPDQGYVFVEWSDGSPTNPRTDLDVQGAISVAASFELEFAPSTTSITAINPSATQTVGQSYSVSVQVEGDNPSGLVSISDGEEQCSLTLDLGGLGSCDLVSTSAGAKSIVASYAGDSNNAASASTPISYDIARIGTSIGSLDASTGTGVIRVGDSVTFTWALTAESEFGAIEGDVSVGNGTDQCSAGWSVGSCTTTVTVEGSNDFGFAYAGNAWYAPSQNSLTVEVLGAIVDPTIDASVAIRVQDSLVMLEDVGDWVSFEIVVQNTGPNPVAGATLLVALPEQFSSAPGDTLWDCHVVGDESQACGSGTDFIDELVDLAVGEGRRYVLTGMIPAMHPRGLVRVDAVLDLDLAGERFDTAIYQRCTASNMQADEFDGDLRPHLCVYRAGFEDIVN